MLQRWIRIERNEKQKVFFQIFETLGFRGKHLIHSIVQTPREVFQENIRTFEKPKVCRQINLCYDRNLPPSTLFRHSETKIWKGGTRLASRIHLGHLGCSSYAAGRMFTFSWLFAIFCLLSQLSFEPVRFMSFEICSTFDVHEILPGSDQDYSGFPVETSSNPTKILKHQRISSRKSTRQKSKTQSDLLNRLSDRTLMLYHCAISFLTLLYSSRMKFNMVVAIATTTVKS